MEIDKVDLSKCLPNKDFGCGFYTTLGLLIRQFSRGTIDVEYMKREFDFGKLTNQYTFHTEKSLKYLEKVGVMHDKSTTGND